MGAQVLFKSTDRGSSWQKISGDLTLDINRDTLTMMGKVVGPDALSRNDGQTSYGSLTTIGESPLNAHGDLHRQRRRPGAAHEGRRQDVDERHEPHSRCRRARTSARCCRRSTRPARVYVTFDGHYNDDYKPYVFVSEDFGATWRSLSAGLPETSVNRIREHPTNPRVLVLAHERGVHVSNDGGATWNSLATNMPTVPSDDAIFQERDNALVIGTHGRGIWILDDAGPLEALTADAMKADATLAPDAPRAAHEHVLAAGVVRRRRVLRAEPGLERRRSAYYLRDGGQRPGRDHDHRCDGQDGANAQGAVARGDEPRRVGSSLRAAGRFERTRRRAGGRRWWRRSRRSARGGRRSDSQVPAREAVAAAVRRLGRSCCPGTLLGARRGSGRRQAADRNVVVDADPLPKFSAADRAARQMTLMRIYEWTKALGVARTAARALVAQRDSIAADFKAGAAPDAASRADSLNARIARTSAEIDRTFTAVNGQRAPIENWSGPPTIDQLKALGFAIDDAQKAIAELNKLVSTEIPSTYKTVANKDWPRKVKPVSMPAIRGG